MSRLEIAVPPSFRFEATIQSHGWYVLAPFAYDERSRVLHRVETLESGLAIPLRIRFTDRLVLDSPLPLTPHRDVLRKRMRRMFQLGVDLDDFLLLCSVEETHRRVAAAGFGRLLCGSTVFEDAVKIIATTNTAWSQTKRMVSLLVEKFGPRTADGAAGFPSPENLAGQTPEILKEECRLGYRAQYVHSLATGVASGTIDLDRITSSAHSTPQLFDMLKTLPGIGPYGAAHLMAMEGRHDFIAVDTEFRRFVRERYHGGRNVSDKTMLRRYKRWGKWQYLAYWSELWDEVSEEVGLKNKPQ